MLCFPKHDVTNDENRRPLDTPMRQQQMRGWSPTPTSQTAIYFLFVLSVFFVPIGVILLTTGHVIEHQIDYTECNSVESNQPCADIRTNQSRMYEKCTCQYDFTLDYFLPGDITVYYGLDNFYQNHRRYVKSRDDVQLHGEQSLDASCEPYHQDKNGIPVAPCGAVANSMFNDTFSLYNSTSNFTIVRTGITRERDKGDKFRNPQGVTVSDAFKGFAKPLFWQTAADGLDPLDASNNGYLNEAFIVWMRVSAFYYFRKKYGLLGIGWNGLSKGSYTLTIDYNYPVTSFGGKKRLILSADSWMGSKNDFLGIAYLVLGVFCFLAGVCLFVARYLHLKQQIARICTENASVSE